MRKTQRLRKLVRFGERRPRVFTRSDGYSEKDLLHFALGFRRNFRRSSRPSFWAAWSAWPRQLSGHQLGGGTAFLTTCGERFWFHLEAAKTRGHR